MNQYVLNWTDGPYQTNGCERARFVHNTSYNQSFSGFWYPPGTSESRDSPSNSRYSQVDINLVHPIRTTQLAISRFANATTPKSIIHTSSIAGQIPSFCTPVYAAAKHGINGFVRSLERLDQIGIRVTAVAPAFIKTPLWTESPDKMRMIEESKDDWVTPEEVATVMLALVQQDKISESIIETPKGKNDDAMITVTGGLILEVSKSVREVSTFNDPGPFGRPGNSGVDPNEAEEEFLRLVQSRNWGKPVMN